MPETNNSKNEIVPKHAKIVTSTNHPLPPDIRNKRGKKVHTKLVHKRNLFWNIIFALCTTIYQLFWCFEIDKETKAITKNNKGVSSCRVVVFSIITFGIYTYVWIYKNAEKQQQYVQEHNLPVNKTFALKCTLIAVIGETVLIIAYLVCNGLLLNVVADNFFAIISFTGLPILSIPFVVVFAMMQSKNNKLLLIEQQNGRNAIYVRNSDILNRPLWGSIFLLFAAEIIVNCGEVIGDAIVGIIAPGTNYIASISAGAEDAVAQQAQKVIDADTIQTIIPSVCVILAGFLVMLAFCMWFRHYKIEGLLTKRNIAKAFLFCLPAFSLCIVNIFGFFIEEGINVKFGLVLLGFIPGVTEEVVFRGLLIPNFIRIKFGKLGIYLALFSTSLVFGLVHITNILAGANVETTIFQVVYAAAIGFIFAAVIIRTGNIWPTIVCHGLYDTLAYMAPSAMTQGAIQTQAFELTPDVIVVSFLSIGLIAYAIFICRPKKHKEILDVWSRKLKGSILPCLKVKHS